MLRRVASSGGFWQGVSGGVEDGEELAETALRELIEETQLEPSALHKIDFSYSFPAEGIWGFMYEPGVQEIMEYAFVAHVDPQRQPVISREHDQWKWCSFDEAFKLLFWPDNKEALARCYRILRAGS